MVLPTYTRPVIRWRIVDNNALYVPLGASGSGSGTGRAAGALPVGRGHGVSRGSCCGVGLVALLVVGSLCLHAGFRLCATNLRRCSP